jgi:hypothetical protein
VSARDAWFSHTILKGRVALRVNVENRRMRRDDIDRLLRVIGRPPPSAARDRPDGSRRRRSPEVPDPSLRAGKPGQDAAPNRLSRLPVGVVAPVSAGPAPVPHPPTRGRRPAGRFGGVVRPCATRGHGRRRPSCAFAVDFTVREGWHLYAHGDTVFYGVDLTGLAPGPLAGASVVYPEGRPGDFFGTPVRLLTGRASGRLPKRRCVSASGRAVLRCLSRTRCRFCS